MSNPALPAWLMDEVRQARKGRGRKQVNETTRLLERLRLVTVCDNARCPNRGECFSHGTATFLILGEVCTRCCAFCAVKHGPPQGPPDPNEPERLASAVLELGLKHAVITSVTRDDLPDGGSGHYARVGQELRLRCPGVRVEVLVPDFLGAEESLVTVLDARPDILAHNVETVPRLYKTVRRGADYARSLALLRRTKELTPSIITKSGLMLGLGESETEVESVLQDLAAAGCDMITIGQYLAPSLAHTPVKRYVHREEFDSWREKALGLGFKSAASGPLVRSSYKAPLFFGEIA
ncbi:MAG: lipoyl synthase [Syntrophobacteraceae bacterium]